MSQQSLTQSPQSLTILSVGQNRPNFSLAGPGPQAPQVISFRGRHRKVHVVDYGNARLTHVTTYIVDLLVVYVFLTSYPKAISFLLPSLFSSFLQGSLAPHHSCHNDNLKGALHYAAVVCEQMTNAWSCRTHAMHIFASEFQLLRRP